MALYGVLIAMGPPNRSSFDHTTLQFLTSIDKRVENVLSPLYSWLLAWSWTSMGAPLGNGYSFIQRNVWGRMVYQALGQEHEFVEWLKGPSLRSVLTWPSRCYSLCIPFKVVLSGGPPYPPGSGPGKVPGPGTLSVMLLPSSRCPAAWFLSLYLPEAARPPLK